MSDSGLPALRPLAVGAVMLDSEGDEQPLAEPLDRAPMPWEGAGGRSVIQAELKSFCHDGELVYAAVVDRQGVIAHAVCTVGARPHNEVQIGKLVRGVILAAAALGEEVGEADLVGMNFAGERWSYTLEPVVGEHLLFGIYPSSGLPAVVRAGAKKCLPAIELALDP